MGRTVSWRGSAYFAFICFTAWWSTAVRGPQPHHAEDIRLRYGSVPKGVILEESALGMEPVRRLAYDRTRHELVLNDGVRYAFPLPPDECAAILRSIASDDRLGVSIVLGERRIVYGTVDARESITRSLFAADVFLVSVVFGWTENLAGITLPGGYQPRRSARRGARTVCFSRFDGYRFAKSGNRYVRSDSRLELTLVPMAPHRAPDGGYLPDEAALARNEYDQNDLANRAHVHKRMADYLALPVVSRPVMIGEVAAVARYLRDGGVDLGQLAERVDMSPVTAPARRADALTLERRLVSFAMHAPDPDAPREERLARAGMAPAAQHHADDAAESRHPGQMLLAGGRHIGRGISSGCARMFNFIRPRETGASVQPDAQRMDLASGSNAMFESRK